MKKLSGVDWGTVGRTLAGGAALGTSAGAAVTFLHHLKELQDKSQLANDTSADDDVLYVDVPTPGQPRPVSGMMRPKRASANANTGPTFALSALSGLVGSAVAYNAVRGAYNKRRRREVQQDLDNSQHIYLGNLTNSKSAGQYSLPTKIVGSGELALMMTALGSAVVANKLLKNRFPPIQSATQGQPRKIVIRSVDRTTHQPIPEQETVSDNVSPDALEGMVRTQMSNPKMASDNELVDVVCAVAAGRGQEIKNLIKQAGVDGMLDGIKGASRVPTNSVDRNLAVSWICRDGLVSEALSPIIAAEFFKHATWTFDVLPQLPALGLDEKNLIGMLEAANVGVRECALRPVFDKMASVIPKSAGVEMESPMKTLFMAGLLGNVLSEDTADKQPTPTTSALAGDDSHPRGKHPRYDLEIDDDDARNFAARNMPAVDRTLARA